MSPPEIETGRLRTRDGAELHFEKTPSGGNAWLIGVHGIAEHLGRQPHLRRLFADKCQVFQYDLRGHGRSGGPRGDVDSFAVFYRDLGDVITHLASENPDFQYTLCGHSMGALIAAGFVQSMRESVPAPQALFLASPPIGLGGLGGAIVNRIPRCVFSVLCRLSIGFPTRFAVNRHYLSHDKDVAARLRRDPLVSKHLNLRLLAGLVDASKRVFSRPISAPCPLHAAIGSADRIVSCPAARRYFATHEPAANFRVIEGAYHELHHETALYRQRYFAFLQQALAPA